MPVRIIPKRNSAPGYVPRPDELEEGEIALNTYDGILFAKLANGEVRQIGQTSPVLDQTASEVAVNPDSLIGSGEMLEYGSWTPQIVAVGSGAVQPSVSYENRQGVFCRVGPLVVINGRLRFTATGGSGLALAIEGLPFAHGTTREGNDVVKIWGAGSIGYSGGTSALKPLTLWGGGGSTRVWLGKVTDGTDDNVNTVYFAPDDATGVLDIVFSYAYQTLYSGGA